ncbi:MAG: GNAT family N-acetyltransferase [Acetobacteraceae bacterium]|nr:GNAT family N-acetyltransferase [Acetobacteraceae bacterium]
MIEVALTPIEHVAALESRWRELETRSDHSFFLSWTWIGCLAGERFDRPVLLEGRIDGRTSALAVLNRRDGRLFLNETGWPAWDSPFIEHNGILCAREQESALLPLSIAKAAAGRLTLSGVGGPALAAAQTLPGTARLSRERTAPYIDYAKLGPGPYLDSLSANSRYQIRRSDRRYAEQGPLHLDRAGSTSEAHRFLDALAVLHQRSWRRRSRPGAFSNPLFARFHHELIERASAAGEVDLLRICAGNAVLGYLYNFVHRGHVYAYQSGFDFETPGSQHKPGLTCHHLAIEMYRAGGLRRYDMLGGPDRYKLSLANAHEALYWVDYVAPYSSAWFVDKLLRTIRKRA